MSDQRDPTAFTRTGFSKHLVVQFLMFLLVSAGVAAPTFAQTEPATTVTKELLHRDVGGTAEKRQVRQFLTDVGKSASDISIHSLAAMDQRALASEDSIRLVEGQPLRVGIVQETHLSFSDGEWLDHPLGKLWVVKIASPDAYALRPHFRTLKLPPTARCVIYDAKGTSPPGYITTGGNFVADQEDIWGPIIPASSFIIEVFIPDSLNAPGEDETEMDLLIDGVITIYRNLEESLLNESPDEGSCHNDVTCYSSWINFVLWGWTHFVRERRKLQYLYRPIAQLAQWGLYPIFTNSESLHIHPIRGQQRDHLLAIPDHLMQRNSAVTVCL